MIYFDHNATTQPLASVVQAMLPFLCDEFGNPSSVYQHGTKARAAIEQSRAALAETLGAVPSELTFTGSGTEADQLAILGALWPYLGKGGRVLFSNLEHPAVSQLTAPLRTLGFEVDVFEVVADADHLRPVEDLLSRVDSATRLVSCMAANNETGLLLGADRLFRAIKKVNADIVCHTDAVQALGKIPLNVHAFHADLMSFSSHKIHGPKGVGAFWMRKGLTWQPPFPGGGQENGRRSGTENVAAIVGFGRAVQAISPVHQATMVRLRDRFEQGLNQRFGQRVTIHHHALERTPNTSSVSFSGKDGNTLLIQLDLAGVCASTGSACHSGALGVSPILIACGIKESLAKSTLRFSFSHTNTEDEVDQLLTLLQRLG